MAPDPLDALRLTLMQDVLPVGLAVAERVRRGGPSELMAAFDGTDPDPLGKLRQEGEPAASQLRENLDRLQPGLGNPVMKVDVRDIPEDARASEPGPAAAEPSGQTASAADLAELQATLQQIAGRLQLLERRLSGEGDSSERADPA